MKKDGFTMIELLTVMIIVVILGIMGGCSFFLIKSCNAVSQEVSERGIRAIATEIWEGPKSETNTHSNCSH